MHIPKTIEIVLADLMREQQIGEKTMIRCWHVLENDVRWRKDEDRKFPCIDIRCAPPMPTSNPSTLTAIVAIEIAALSDDDISHSMIATIEEGVQTALDKLYSQCRKQTGESLTAFQTAFNNDCAPAKFGYMTFSGSTAPYDENGLNIVGISIEIHFTRADFNL